MPEVKNDNRETVELVGKGRNKDGSVKMFSLRGGETANIDYDPDHVRNIGLFSSGALTLSGAGAEKASERLAEAAGGAGATETRRKA